MPRPRRLNVDLMQGFNCSYQLKVGMMRAAEIGKKESPSSLIREVMEEFCKGKLSASEWGQLKDSESAEYRHRRLGEVADKNWFSEMKGQLAGRLATGISRKELKEQLVIELELLARQLEGKRDDHNHDLGIRVALQEAADLVQQLRHLCRKEKTSGSQAKLGLLFERFPPFWKPAVTEIVREFI